MESFDLPSVITVKTPWVTVDISMYIKLEKRQEFKIAGKSKKDTVAFLDELVFLRAKLAGGKSKFMLEHTDKM